MKRNQSFSRRSFLSGAAIATVGAISGSRRDAFATTPAPKEGGLSSEGLLAGLPGFQPRTVAPLVHDELPGFLSRAQLQAHHAEYAKSMAVLKAAELELRTADRSPDAAVNYAGLRQRQVEAGNDTLLHELYFRNLAPETIALPRYLKPHLDEHIGSIESWKNDFIACAAAAKKWAALVYDPYDDRWHNTVMDSNVDGVWIGANPLVVCDVAEHAYARDYPRREEYVAKFLERIDWNEVAARYRSADRM